MPQNQYLPIANSPTANALTPQAWAALATTLQQGFASGEVLSQQFNTFLRQFSVPVAAIAQFVADNQTQDVLDDGSVANFEAKFGAALLAFAAREGVAFAVDGGTSDVLSGTPVPALTTYRTGQVIAIQKSASVATNATATPSVNLNGLGAVTIVKASGAALYAGDLPQGGVFFAVYDGQYFRHIGLTLSTAGLLVQAGQAVAFTANGTNAYTGTLVPAPTALTPRMEVLGFFGTANTSAAAPTLLLNGIGVALPILKQGGGVPSAGDVSGIVPLVLNTAGTAWLINGLATSDVLALIPAAAVAAVSANKTTLVYGPGSYTWTCPANVAKIDIYARGGGGGGGGCTGGTQGSAAGGGGGGSYFIGTFAVVPGTAYYIAVGTGGTQGAAAGSNGGVGGSTSFSNVATAPGGNGGGVSNGSPVIGTGGAGGAVPTVPAGVLAYPGTPGSNASSVSGTGTGGAGGGSYGQGATNLAAIGGGGGIGGQLPGLGGNGGGGGAYPGGTGAPGELVIRY